MKKFLVKTTVSLLSLVTLVLFVLFPTPSLAQDANTTYSFSEQSGLGAAANSAGYETGASASSFDSIISTLIYVIISFVGVIFFILLLYGGFIWMTAQGNDAQVKKATGIITNSIIGLAIAMSAYAISYFLISYFWQ